VERGAPDWTRLILLLIVAVGTPIAAWFLLSVPLGDDDATVLVASLVGLGVLLVAPVFICYRMGRARNRRGWPYAFLLGWPGVLLLALLGRSKKCPDCAELVRADARVCKHCGHRFASEGWPMPQQRT